MQLLFKIFLALHIMGGATGLIAGTINLLRVKGDRLHRRAGTAFMYGMYTAAGCALVLSVIHPNAFLFIVGVFTIYMTATGKRYLLFKQKAIEPGIIDWLLALVMGLTSLAFIVLGLFKLTEGQSFGIVYFVFGLLGARFVRTDIINYKGRSTVKNYWLTTHLQRMMGSYIAAITAFLVVNVPSSALPAVPHFVFWLLPTAIVVPLIISWTRKYKLEAVPKAN